MGNKYTKIATKPVPQSQPIPGRESAMTKNSAGGYSFALDKWKMLERFLILGAEGGSYYIQEQKLVADNVKSLMACIAEDPKRVASVILEISVNGRAFKNDPAELALAQLIKTGGEARRAGWSIFGAVIRTGRTLLEFNMLLEAMEVKWGAARRKAFSNWYNTKTADQIAYQVLKYPSASGWTHKDILRLCHASGGADEHGSLFKYIVDKPAVLAELPTLVQGWEEIKKAKTIKEAVKLVEAYKLTWEFVPGQFQGSIDVWAALLPNLPFTALIRNLGRITSYGLLTGVNDSVKFVRDKLTNRDGLRKARVHPMTLLIAKKTYEEGASLGAAKGRKDALSWTANKRVSDALEDAFYLAFDAVEPSGKDMFFGIDVSGSMGTRMMNLPISCAEAAAVMAMVSIRQEKNSIAMGFADKFRDLNIGKNDALDAVLRKTRMSNFGSTDCAVPMIHALDNGMSFDQFVILTDAETWVGKIHPSEAIKKYRQKTGIDAKLIVCGMVANHFTIADPADAGMLDCVGFDTSVPALISKFAQGL